VQVVFETAMVVRDLFTGGKRTFASTADARHFRERIYAAHGLAVPKPAAGFRPPQVRTSTRSKPYLHTSAGALLCARHRPG
jgi:hypothetical protein